MDVAEVMKALAAAGTEQHAKIYRAHGARGDLFGVSFADLGKLSKRTRTDHPLAEALWETGNVDARILATMVADPRHITRELADRWVQDLDYHTLAEYVAGAVSKSRCARERVFIWMDDTREYVRQAGYSMLAVMLRDGMGDFTDEELSEVLAKIEREVHASANRARYAMNNAVIAIGVYRPTLTEPSLEAAGRIGPVEVDHGETSCKTPDAASYIRRTLERGKRSPRVAR